MSTKKGKKPVAEGKTKIVWPLNGTDEVLIESKAVLTAGDGVKRDALEGKDVYSTTTTANCFRLLNKNRIPTHFIKQVNDKIFQAYRAQMIPFEVVVRRIATGSFIKRNPETAEGTIFEDLVVEIFLKDDARHDPLVIFDRTSRQWKLYDAKQPLSAGSIEELPPDHFFFYGQLVDQDFISTLSRIARKVFLILEEAWARLGVSLVDLKIEFGFNKKTGRLMVADVIDNDSWRIWPAGDKTQMKDKQVYRNLAAMTPEAKAALKENYKWVAEATEKFLNA